MKAKTTILLGLLCAVIIILVTYYFLPSAYHNRTVGQKNKYHFEKIVGTLKENPELLEKAVFPEDPYFSTKVLVVINKTAKSTNDTLSSARINKLSEENYRIYIKIPFEEWEEQFEKEIDDYFSKHKEENHALQNLFFLEIEYVKGHVVSAVVSKDFSVYEELCDDIPILRLHNIYDAKATKLRIGEVISEETSLGVIKMAKKTINKF